MMNHATTEVFFDDLRVPGREPGRRGGRGFRCILSGMNAERILHRGRCVGDAKWFIAKATAYAKERVVFGAPIGGTRASSSRSRGPTPTMRARS
jgi:alkylation response protein AidB-like acyl-CoA dehydrogenase